MGEQTWDVLQDSAVTQHGCKASGLWVPPLAETTSRLVRAGVLKLLTKYFIPKSLLHGLLHNRITHLTALS